MIKIDCKVDDRLGGRRGENKEVTWKRNISRSIQTSIPLVYKIRYSPTQPSFVWTIQSRLKKGSARYVKKASGDGLEP